MYLCILAVSALNVGAAVHLGQARLAPHPDRLSRPDPARAEPLLAIGTFISTLTKNRSLPAQPHFPTCLLLWILSWVSSYNEAPWAAAVAYCSILTHFEPFTKGIIDTKDLVFYISAIFLGLFLTSRSLDSLRWRA